MRITSKTVNSVYSKSLFPIEDWPITAHCEFLKTLIFNILGFGAIHDGNKKACTSLPFPCLALFGSITDIAVVKQSTGNFLQPNFLNSV